MDIRLPHIPIDAQRDLSRAIDILTSGGCSAIFLFGSAAKGDMSASSDLDLAVRGCPPQHFFHLLGRLMTSLDYAVDLIDLDVPSPFVEFLLTKGEMVQLV